MSVSSAAWDILRPDYSVPSYRPLHSRGISVRWPEDHAPKTEQAKAGIVGLEASYTPQEFRESIVTVDTDSGESAQIDSAFMNAAGEIGRYFSYEPRWDGYFAKQFDSNVLIAGLRILDGVRRYLRTEEVVPTLLTTCPASDGSIDVEVRTEHRTLFCTIYSDVDVEVAAIAKSVAPLKGKIPLDETALVEWLDWLVGKTDLPKTVDNHRLHTQ